MFGHQDNNSQTNGVVAGTGGEPQAEAMLPQATAATTFAPSTADDNSAPASVPAVSEDTGAGNFMANAPQPAAPSAPAADDNSVPVPSAGGDLLSLKQNALQQLTPLLGHLEQTPEEKFRTTMMMIQAADNQSLLHTAYEAARAIPDEKTRAQALLDVVNEINYFTQQQHPDAA